MVMRRSPGATMTQPVGLTSLDKTIMIPRVLIEISFDAHFYGCSFKLNKTLVGSLSANYDPIPRSNLRRFNYRGVYEWFITQGLDEKTANG